MKDCLPCKCGSNKLIPDIYINGNEPTTVKIRCVDCGKEGKEHISTEGAIFLWNTDRRNDYDLHTNIKS